jgi:hypothetical protein
MNLIDAISTYCNQSIEVRSTLVNCFREHTRPPLEEVFSALESLMWECKAVEQVAAKGKRLAEKKVEAFATLSSLSKQITEYKNFMNITKWSMEPLICKMESLGSTLKSFEVFFSGVLDLARLLVDGVSDGLKEVEEMYGSS